MTRALFRSADRGRDHLARPFAVVIRTGRRPKLWGNYATLTECETVAAKLRAHAFDAIAVDTRLADRIAIDEPA